MEILSATKDFTSRSPLPTSLTSPRCNPQNSNSSAAEAASNRVGSSNVMSSSKTPTTTLEDSSRSFYLKRYMERFKPAEQLLKYSPDEQTAIEESFRLKRNPDSPAIRKPKRRETYSQISQQIIEEKLESSKTPKRLIEAELFTTTRKFWKVGSEEQLPPDQRILLVFEPDDGVGIKINPKAKLLKHMVTDNHIINRNWGIDEKVLPDIVSPKRSGSLCVSERLSNKQGTQCDYDMGGHDLNQEDSEKLKRKSVRFSPIQKHDFLPKVKFAEKVKEILGGDSEYFSLEESENSSRTDMDSTMNSISSQQNVPTSESESYSSRYKKSRFSMKTTSLGPETFSQALKCDLELAPAIYSKSTPKASNLNTFPWNIEEYGLLSPNKAFDRDGRKNDSRRSSILSPKSPQNKKLTLPQLKVNIPRGLKTGQSTPSNKGYKSP